MDRGSWKWRRVKAVLYREALDDVVILVPGPQPEPFALAGGAHLWRLLEEPRTTGDLLAALNAGQEDLDEKEEELDELLGRLVDSGAVDRLAA
jgi:hypothetical protein